MTFKPSYNLIKIGTYALWSRDSGWSKEQILEAVEHYLDNYTSLEQFKEEMRHQNLDPGH